jgi:hypothetical protein
MVIGVRFTRKTGISMPPKRRNQRNIKGRLEMEEMRNQRNIENERNEKKN